MPFKQSLTGPSSCAPPACCLQYYFASPTSLPANCQKGERRQAAPAYACSPAGATAASAAAALAARKLASAARCLLSPVAGQRVAVTVTGGGAGAPAPAEDDGATEEATDGGDEEVVSTPDYS
jgi:hypothetical protein